MNPATPAHRVSIVTNVTEYIGMPAAAALVAAGSIVLCHSASFASASAREAFATKHPGLAPAEALSPEDLVAEAMTRFGRIDALISNDFCVLPSRSIEGDIDGVRATIEALLVTPFRLARAAVPIMKEQRVGRIVLVTSGAPLQYPAGTMPAYTAARAGANTLARSLAVELGPFNIQVNAVAPFLVYNQTFFPSEIGIDDPKFIDQVNARVPMRRFGRPEEAGELIAFLVSGKSDFVSGQVIAFSGGGV